MELRRSRLGDYYHMEIAQGAEAFGRSSDCLLQGWLYKRGDSVQSWKRRYFVAQPITLLHYFADKTDTCPRGVIPIGMDSTVWLCRSCLALRPSTSQHTTHTHSRPALTVVLYPPTPPLVPG